MTRYELIVGNIGTVYSGPNGMTAYSSYQSYAGKSKRNEGRAAGEDVSLFKNGELVKEFFGTLHVIDE